MSINAKGIDQPITARLLQIGMNNGSKRAVLYWYYLPNLSSSNSLHVKLTQAMNVLLGKGDSGAVIALSMPYNDNPGASVDIETTAEPLVQYAKTYAQSLQSIVVFE